MDLQGGASTFWRREGQTWNFENMDDSQIRTMLQFAINTPPAEGEASAIVTRRGARTAVDEENLARTELETALLKQVSKKEFAERLALTILPKNSTAKRFKRDNFQRFKSQVVFAVAQDIIRKRQGNPPPSERAFWMLLRDVLNEDAEGNIVVENALEWSLDVKQKLGFPQAIVPFARNAYDVFGRMPPRLQQGRNTEPGKEIIKTVAQTEAQVSQTITQSLRNIFQNLELWENSAQIAGILFAVFGILYLIHAIGRSFQDVFLFIVLLPEKLDELYKQLIAPLFALIVTFPYDKMALVFFILSILMQIWELLTSAAVMGAFRRAEEQAAIASSNAAPSEAPPAPPSAALPLTSDGISFFFPPQDTLFTTRAERRQMTSVISINKWAFREIQKEMQLQPQRLEASVANPKFEGTPLALVLGKQQLDLRKQVKAIVDMRVRQFVSRSAFSQALLFMKLLQRQESIPLNASFVAPPNRMQQLPRLQITDLMQRVADIPSSPFRVFRVGERMRAAKIGRTSETIGSIATDIGSNFLQSFKESKATEASPEFVATLQNKIPNLKSVKVGTIPASVAQSFNASFVAS